VLADAKEDVAPNDLSKHVPADKGRYIFYLFKHTFEGDYLESIGERKLPFQGCGLAKPSNTVYHCFPSLSTTAAVFVGSDKRQLYYFLG